MRYLLLCGGLIGALAVGPAIADSYKFTLYNHSKYAIEGFQTYETESGTPGTMSASTRTSIK